ncbi:NACHT and WD repeat domain-containing protein [Streptomyces sp. NPDC058412]|uniref:NACHT and WD repeat domain-containing protein n=1 Tax=Streptomyces sp. NPDC058412 TaxID=3346486 RepID=UPI003658FBC3
MSRTTEGRGAPGLMVLSIGVGTFAEGSELEDLGFVRSRVKEVQAAFGQFGAEGETSLDLPEGEIEALLRKWIVDEPGTADVLVVHLIGHGRADRSGRLSFVAHDDRDVDVDRWIEKAQQEAERAGGGERRVVFLIDTCSAGTATGRQSVSELDGRRGVWSLGASVSSSPTEQGRFSGWITAALDVLRYRDFAPDVETVGFTRFVKELIAQIKADTTTRRMSLGFSVEQGDGEWPFLPNPLTLQNTPEQIQLLRRSLGYVPGEDLGDRIAAGEKITDGLYFIDRASGRGLFSTDHSTGFFSGRAAELEHYRTWLAGDSPLLTVTGAAGAGKSGLLGLIVCAAHPHLRRTVRALWEPAGPDLPEVPDVVAVHARQRSAQQVMTAIVEQAGLALPKQDGPDGEAPEQAGGGSQSVGWSPGLLREALEREQRNRLIVVDAVDESTDPRAVLRLVSVLVAPDEQDGAASVAPCRILLGGRREGTAELSSTAEASGIAVDRIDLDTADPVALQEDVQRYVVRLLRASKPYAYGPPSDFVDYLAKEGAQNIVRRLRPDGLWGPFLIAGLYVHYLVTLKNPPQDEATARAHTLAASSELPHLMEAVLAARKDEFGSLRAFLAVLARSQGDGMPRTTLRRCLRALGTDDISDRTFLATLREATPFLRTGVDPESDVALYRIFHQGLADYLRDHPVSSDPVDAARSLDLERRLLSEVVGPFTADAGRPGDRWDSAEPYALRHALGHLSRADSPAYAETLLTDPYFLIRFDPRQDPGALDLAQSERAAEYVRLLSASWSSHSQLRSASDRASVFAFDAHRLTLPEHQKQFARIGREVGFQPEEAHTVLWAEGGRVDSSARCIEYRNSVVHNVAFSPDGSLLAAATTSGVKVTDTATWQSVGPLLGHAGTSDVTFSPDGRLLAFATRHWTGNVHLWDVRRRILVGQPWACRTGAIRALAFSPDSRHLAIGSADLDVSVWDVTGEHQVEAARLEFSGAVTKVCFSPDGLLLAASGTSGLTVWRTTDWHRTSLSTDSTRGVAFSPDGRLLAALNSNGVGLWSGDTLEFLRPAGGGRGFRSNVAFSADGSLLAFGSLSSLKVVDLVSGRTVSHQTARSADTTSLVFHPSDVSLLVSGDANGQVRLWRAPARSGAAAPRLPQFDPSGAVGSPDGRLIAILNRTTARLELRDPATGHALAAAGPMRNVLKMAFSPDSQTLVAVSYAGVLHVIRTGSGPLPPAETMRVEGAASSTSPLTFSSDSRLFALMVEEPPSRTSVIKVWAAHDLRLVQRIPLPGRPSHFGFAGPEKLFVTIDGAVAVYGCDGTHAQETPA